MCDLTDSELVEAARKGETSAFGELVRRHQKHVFAVTLSLINDVAEAEDLTQESFIRAFRNLDLLADPGKFAAWARRIAFGVSIDWLRAFRPELYRSSEAIENDAALIRSGAPSPLERLQQMELSERVLSALALLPARYRVPLTMYHIEGLSHERVAKALNVPIGTVRSLVSRAHRKLAPILESYAKEALPMTRSVEEVFREQPQESARFLHIHNGDSTCGTLERSDVPGINRVWADVLHEGPAPADLSHEQFREMRARFVAAQGWETYEMAVQRYQSWDESLASFPEYDEVIMWFEHDLFDQLILIHHLDFFARQTMGRTRLSLICIGEYSGVEPFHGLGQLNTDQLASLLGTRQQVTPQQLELGGAAWRAFTSSDPTQLGQMLHGDTSALPFLKGALHRFLEEYPSTKNGLPRTERQILTALASGPQSPERLFLAMYPLEERIFMGDTTFWTRVKWLASGSQPLVEWDVVERPHRIPKGEVRITNAGRNVIEGWADWIGLNGIDRWYGGVHLQGPEAAWRWDEQTARLRPMK